MKQSAEKKENRIAGLILAAGYSSRMGAFKPLLPIGDKTAIGMISSAMRKAGVQNMIGVSGYQREQLNSIFTSEGIVEAYNPNYDQGMFSSIKAGIAKAMSACTDGIGAPEMPEGFFLMPVDCPLVPPEVFALILEKHREEPDAFIVPCYHGKKGHPLFIPKRYAEEILSYEDGGGLKAITNRHEDRLIRIEVDSEAVVLDMDTPEGYAEILDYYAGKRQSGRNLDEELRGKRLFLIRHGEILQHSEKIFLGQADIPLSEKGREQAAMAADSLRQQGVASSRIYTSDLSRTWETAEIIRYALNPRAVIITESRLRELSLGEWDGRLISEIREKYPEEYQRRGQNLVTYKHGNNSENFFDLQYRAIKGLQHILEQERKAEPYCRDIVIVSHSGVINVIISRLRHTTIEDEIRNHIPFGSIVTIDYSDDNMKEKQG